MFTTRSKQLVRSASVLAVGALFTGASGQAHAGTEYIDAIDALNPYAHLRFDDAIAAGQPGNLSGIYDTMVESNFDGGTAYNGYVVNTDAPTMQVPGPVPAAFGGLEVDNEGARVGNYDGGAKYISITDGTGATFTNGLGAFASGMTAGVTVNFFLKVDESNITASDIYLMGAVGSGTNFQIRTAQDGIFVFLRDASNDFGQIQVDDTNVGNTDAYDNEWHMVTITAGADGAFVPKVYIDGELQSGTEATGGAGTRGDAFNNFTTDWRVGLITSLVSPDATVDELTFLQTQLSQAQITSLYETATIPEPGSLALIGLGALCMFKRSRKQA